MKKQKSAQRKKKAKIVLFPQVSAERDDSQEVLLQLEGMQTKDQMEDALDAKKQDKPSQAKKPTGIASVKAPADRSKYRLV